MDAQMQLDDAMSKLMADKVWEGMQQRTRTKTPYISAWSGGGARVAFNLEKWESFRYHTKPNIVVEATEYGAMRKATFYLRKDGTFNIAGIVKKIAQARECSQAKERERKDLLIERAETAKRSRIASEHAKEVHEELGLRGYTHKGQNGVYVITSDIPKDGLLQITVRLVDHTRYKDMLAAIFEAQAAKENKDG